MAARSREESEIARQPEGLLEALWLGVVTPALVRAHFGALRALRRYHRHQVHGLDRLPDDGPFLLITNHSLATYDIFLLNLAVAEATGREVRGLGDRLFFQRWWTRSVAHGIWAAEACHEVAHATLARGAIACITPGGMYEALRPSRERYQTRWERRKGFSRLAIRTRTPIVLAACPRADDLYTVYSSPLTEHVYRRYRLPLPLARGLGPTPLPRPVRLEHYLSEPLDPPQIPEDEDALEIAAARFHAQISRRMDRLLAQALRSQ